MCSDTLATAPRPPAALFCFPQRLHDSKRRKLAVLCNVFGEDASREIRPWAKRGKSIKQDVFRVMV